MKTLIVFFGALAACSILAPGQTGPFSTTAAVTIEVQPAVPGAISEFAAAIHINLEGVNGSSSEPADLGGLVIPMAFDD